MKVSSLFFVAGLAIAILSIAPANAAPGKAAGSCAGGCASTLDQATPPGSDAPLPLAVFRQRAET